MDWIENMENAAEIKFTLEQNSGLIIQELRNNFLGLPVNYFLWHGKNLVAFSTDKKHWKMASWVEKIKEVKITDELYNNLTKTRDV